MARDKLNYVNDVIRNIIRPHPAATGSWSHKMGRRLAGGGGGVSEYASHIMCHFCTKNHVNFN